MPMYLLELRDQPEWEVFVFEPFPDNFVLLGQRVALSNCKFSGTRTVLLLRVVPTAVLQLMCLPVGLPSLPCCFTNQKFLIVSLYAFLIVFIK